MQKILPHLFNKFAHPLQPSPLGILPQSIRQIHNQRLHHQRKPNPLIIHVELRRGRLHRLPHHPRMNLGSFDILGMSVSPVEPAVVIDESGVAHHAGHEAVDRVAEELLGAGEEGGEDQEVGGPFREAEGQGGRLRGGGGLEGQGEAADQGEHRHGQGGKKGLHRFTSSIQGDQGKIWKSTKL